LKRSVPLWATVVIGVVALFIGIGAGAGGKKDQTSAGSATATVTVTKSAAAAAPVAAAAAPAAATVTVTANPAPVTVTATATATETAAAPAPSSPTGFGDGTYIVGTDIKPGLYKTTGPASSDFPNCYWERDRDLDGGLNSIIDNDNTKGQTTVKIASTDKAFKTTGCAAWVKIG